MKKVGLIKRLLVITYDGLLLIGVLLVSYVPLWGILQLTPSEFEFSIWGQALKAIYLAMVSFSFYGWFWTHGGQTLGLKAWNLYLIKADGSFVDWKTAAYRYLISIASWALVASILYINGVSRWYLAIGFGFTWMLTNKSRATWHDIITDTRIVHQKPENNKT